MAKANPLKKITARAKQIARTGKTWQQSIKQAGKEYRAGKIGATLLIEKGETRRTKPSRVVQVSRTKAGTFKGANSMSGIEKSKAKLERIYVVNYDLGNDFNTAFFNATSIKEAKKIAQFHKRRTPELRGKVKRTIVRLYGPTGINPYAGRAVKK